MNKKISWINAIFYPYSSSEDVEGDREVLAMIIRVNLGELVVMFNGSNFL